VPRRTRGGFLVVAGQWNAEGTSLYGDYWVDRPPLLIAVFRLAHLTGGLLSVRLLGVLAAVAAVLLLASTARRVFGRQAADWTAIVAASLLVTPLYGAIDVNGELIALPLVALGIRAAVEAVLADDVLRVRGAALLTGIAGSAALLVKQNLIDVFVFAVVCWVVALSRGRTGGRSLRDLVLLALVGALLTYTVVMLAALAHGTTPGSVFEATYPFRIEAAKVMAASASDTAELRLHRLGLSFLLSAAPFVLGGFVAHCVRRTPFPEVVWAMLATGTWVTFSVLAGGSYWLHYLIESVPVVALAAGALALRTRLVRVLVGLVVASSLVAAATVLVHPTATPGTTVGVAIQRSAQRGDTVISLFGDPDVLRTTGMTSPYPYLWSLPSRTLDTSLARLRSVLAGSAAPTWVVVRGRRTVDRLSEHGAMTLINQRFRPVGEVCGRTVYLRRDVNRPAVRGDRACVGLDLP
jgi:4-amino-4-deoxy-L-arabinose transferase-like glycosyltransferase